MLSLASSRTVLLLRVMAVATSFTSSTVISKVRSRESEGSPLSAHTIVTVCVFTNCDSSIVRCRWHNDRLDYGKDVWMANRHSKKRDTSPEINNRSNGKH